MVRQFDAIIVGAGQAGPSLAGRLAGAGREVAIIERHLVGGTCVNTGCTPTKTLIASAYAAHLARQGAKYGVVVPGPVSVDMARVQARAAAVSRHSREGNETWLGSMDHCTLIRGHARLTGPHAVEVAGERLEAGQIFLNVGGRAAIPDLPGLDQVPYLTNSGMVDLDVLPRHLIVVGGSYIALELAQAWRRFGSEVTVIEKGSRLIAREDPDISDAVRAFLEEEGIRVLLDSECIRFAPHEEGVAVQAGETPIVGSHVLLAVGRRPNTDQLGLEAAGVATDRRGYITVNDRLETSAAGIWALGDCNGRGAFTHTAYNDFEIVAANLLDGADRKVSDRIPVYALYTDPPLGRAGMGLAEARASGRRVLVGERPMSRVSRAVEKGETHGLMRILVDADDDRILGGTILGPGGDEAIHALIDLMACGARAADLRGIMHIHPTVAELLPTIAGALAPLR